MKTVDVVCGLAVDLRNGDVFMGKRLPDTTRPELWEYPGGKVDKTDKSFEEALAREWWEELGARVTVGKLLTVHTLTFEVRARLFLYAVTLETPVLSNGQGLNSHSEIGWFDPKWACTRLPMAPSAYLAYPDVLEYSQELQLNR